MKRKGISLLITVALAASMLAACGQSRDGSGGTSTVATTTTTIAAPTTAIPNFNPTGYPIVNEPIKLKMFNGIKSNGGPFSNDMSFSKQ